VRSRLQQQLLALEHCHGPRSCEHAEQLKQLP